MKELRIRRERAGVNNKIVGKKGGSNDIFELQTMDLIVKWFKDRMTICE